MTNTTSLQISRPWARVAVEAADTAGGYFTVANEGDSPDRLLSAESPAAERIEIHAIKVVGGDIKMRPVERGLVFYPDTKIELKPRGYHLLLKGLKTPLAPGSKVPVTLTFEVAGAIATELSVEAPGPVGYEMLDVERIQRGELRG
jgi:periplasmic copper chaperone A